MEGVEGGEESTGVRGGIGLAWQIENQCHLLRIWTPASCLENADHSSATAAAAAAKSLQSCLTLCDPIVGSPPGSPVPGILQARTLEWVAISLANPNLYLVETSV